MSEASVRQKQRLRAVLMERLADGYVRRLVKDFGRCQAENVLLGICEELAWTTGQKTASVRKKVELEMVATCGALLDLHRSAEEGGKNG